MADRTAPLSFTRKEGGRSWTVVYDPRLPIVEHLARETARVYDDEKNQAWYETKSDAEHIQSVLGAIESLPLLEIEHARYAEDALRGIPGVAVSRQPFSRKTVDAPNKVVAVAVTDEAFRVATAVVADAIRVSDQERDELTAALDSRALSATDLYEITGFKIGELREALASRTLTKPVAAELRDAYTPINKFGLEKLVRHATTGTLEPRNCEALAGLTTPISVEQATDIFKSFTQRQANQLHEYARSLATPEQRQTIATLLAESPDDRGRISINEADLPTLERRRAYGVIASLTKSDEQTDHIDDFLGDARVQDFFETKAATMRNGRGEGPGYIRSPKTAAERRENANRFLRSEIKRELQRRTGENGESAFEEAPFPNDNVVVLNVLAATPYSVAGFIDNDRTKLVVAESGTFSYAKETAFAMQNHDFTRVMERVDDSPLKDEHLALIRGSRSPEFARGNADPTRTSSENAYTYFANVVDMDASVETVAGLLRASHDARRLAPDAPTRFLSASESATGVLLARHDKTATLLTDDGAALAVPIERIPTEAHLMRKVELSPVSFSVPLMNERARAHSRGR